MKQLDNEDIVKDIMWAHLDSIKLLNLFPTMLIYDTTYKTNKYRLLLLEIIGITSTSMTFIVAFAYLSFERTYNFECVLSRLKGFFVKDNVLPQVIVSDKNLAFTNALETLFSSSTNLLFMFHIRKNSSDEVSYNARFNSFTTQCTHYKTFVDYDQITWLMPFKEKFVQAWIDRVNLGNRKTNRYINYLVKYV
ncbi:putative protein FAR1-RELATED SEQUENCE 10 [Glycine soja]